MPVFTFEKISPPADRGPIPPVANKKQRGVLVQMLDRFAEARIKRTQREDARRLLLDDLERRVELAPEERAGLLDPPVELRGALHSRLPLRHVGDVGQVGEDLHGRPRDLDRQLGTHPRRIGLATPAASAIVRLPRKGGGPAVISDSTGSGGTSG